MMQRPLRRSVPIALVSAAILFSAACLALEPYSAQPGTRAMGMAGVFMPQADDSSAAWYNPAGAKHTVRLKQDVSIDWGELATGALYGADAHTDGFGDNTRGVRFAGLYRAGLDLSAPDSLGFGLVYVRPYSAATYVDAPRSLVDSAPFGRVDADYRQVSGALSGALASRLTLGGTIDFVWTEIECLDFSPCVDNGPSGFGASVGLMYDLLQTPAHSLTLAGLWRSRAALGYDSTPASGVGTVLESYTADRPEVRSVGLGLQAPRSFALFKANVIYEQERWEAASGKSAPLPNYSTWGLAGEVLLPDREGHTIALRLGVRQAAAASDRTTDAFIAAAGAGYEFIRNHMIDVAFQHRRGGGSEADTTSLWSVSYSFQK